MRTLTCTSGVLALVLTGWAQALGLGEIYLRSALNEPLRAEIALVGAGGIDESHVLARLATPADFERAGIERNYELLDLHFAADFAAGGMPMVRVTSQEVVREPYLNFLLELRWPSGRLLREYTVLLDPPGMGALVSDVSPRRARAELPSAADDVGDIAVGSGSHRVATGQTLWQIANRYAPSRMSIHAMEAAIYRLNPDAFRGGDINRLLAGATLRLPTSASLGQHSDQRRSEDPAAMVPATDSDMVLAATDRGRAEQRDTAIIAGGAPSVAEQLVAALAQVERLKSENNELRSKLAQLEAVASGAPLIPDPAPVLAEPVLAGVAAPTEVTTVTAGGGEPNAAIADTEPAPPASIDSLGSAPALAAAESAPVVRNDAQAAASTAAADTGLQADLASAQSPDVVAGAAPASAAATSEAAPPPTEAMPPATAQRAADTAAPAPTSVTAVPLTADNWLSVLLAPYLPVLGILAIAMLVLAFLLLRKRSQARLGGNAGVYGAALEPSSGRIVPTLPMAVEAVHSDDEIAPTPEHLPLRATDYLPANTPAADDEVAAVDVDPAGAWAAAAVSDTDAVALSQLDEIADEAVEPAAGHDLSHWDESPKGGGRNDLSATQLELAQAYLDIEDPDGAREILTQVIATGNVEQQAKARALLDGLGRDVVH